MRKKYALFLVDELAMELVALKAKLDILETKTDSFESSLSNNNLLTSCTISGVTNDWYKRYDTIEVEGKDSFYE